MCRLALFNDDMARYLGVDLLDYHFLALEAKMGGDGMGVAALFPDGRVRIKKRVTMTSLSAAKQIMQWSEMGATHYLFHTRFATTGNKIDHNCHPFRHGNIVSAHNGTCYQFTGAGGMVDHTDSEGAIYTVAKAQLGLDFFDNVSGVWIGFCDGRPWIVKGQTHTDLYLGVRDTAYMYSSSIFKEESELFDNVYSIGEYMWLGEGEKEGKPQPKKEYTWTTNYKSTYAYYDDAEDYRDYDWTDYRGASSKEDTQPTTAIVTTYPDTGKPTSRTWGKREDGTIGFLDEQSVPADKVQLELDISEDEHNYRMETDPDYKHDFDVLAYDFETGAAVEKLDEQLTDDEKLMKKIKDREKYVREGDFFWHKNVRWDYRDGAWETLTNGTVYTLIPA